MVDRGARQAPFLVLWQTTMPSVLTEVGFLSNSEDRRFITTHSGQDKIAKALFNAFSEYKAGVEGNISPLQINNDTQIAEAKPVAPQIKATNDKGVVFRVQICSSPKRVSLNSSEFRAYKGDITEHKVKRVYKYSVGDCGSYSEAIKLQQTIRRGIKDAFTIAFIDGKPATLERARALIE